MTMQRGGMPQQQPGRGVPLPQSTIEFLSSIWSPFDYEFDLQRFGTTVVAAANATNVGGSITVTEPFYVFGVESKAITTGGTAVYPTAGYRIGFKQQNGLDWFNGTLLSSIITGDDPVQSSRIPDWDFPRELQKNDIINVTIDNLSAGAGITVDVALRGYVIRARKESLLSQRR